jgi:anti-sigma B factor antagonist
LLLAAKVSCYIAFLSLLMRISWRIPVPLRTTITEEKNTVIMALAGRIDSFSMEELQEGFAHVKETGKADIILLLKDLEYIDSRASGAFLSFFRGVRNGGGTVRLVGVPPRILELFNVLGVEAFTEVYPSLQQALKNSGREDPTQGVRQASEQKASVPFSAGDIPEGRKTPYGLVGAGIVIVVILFFLFLKPAKQPTTGPEGEMGSRLELLERRVAQLESRLMTTSKVEESGENLSKGVSERLSLIEKDLGRLKGDMESLVKKTTTFPEKSQVPRAPSAYHVVSKGETLYRIALRYNVTVEALRSLNNLKPEQPLLAGQRLLIRPQ